KSFAGELAGRAVPVDVAVSAHAGQRLRVTVQAEGHAALTLEDDEPLAVAVKHPVTQEMLEQQWGRLGGTGFVLRRLTASLSGAPMVPLSVLGRLRREMVAQLTAQRDALPPRVHTVCPETVLPRLRAGVERVADHAAEPQLSVLCRSLHQLHLLLAHRPALVYADFQDIREYRQAVALAHEAQTQIYLATPRIQKPGELGIFHALYRHRPDGVLVRNLAGLEFFRQRGTRTIADYSLNAANELTVAYLQQLGAERVTASYDLNRDQLVDLAQHGRVEQLEVVIHQHMPMFHMEHCVFCAVLSPGSNKTNCGRPCDRHDVQLRDRVGSAHPLKADVGCRNTLYNATPQSGAEVVPALLRCGVRYFRIELLHDEPAQRLAQCVQLYRDLIAGQVSARHVWTTLQAVNRAGVTRGTLEHRRDPLAIL
ncbi:MAG: DUF3656 domain-containing protein, partial [Pirellulaceae bacterium]|nr:DUF3656 domain-containing protein [Pirellulaceae bacterium]